MACWVPTLEACWALTLEACWALMDNVTQSRTTRAADVFQVLEKKQQISGQPNLLHACAKFQIIFTYRETHVVH